ncbi:MAG: hypothetical protein AB1412_01075 [Pseudomonadota bacterium]
MNTCTQKLLGVSFGLLALGTTQAADTLAPQQIADLWMGKTMVGKTAEGEPLTVRFNTDGSAEIHVGKLQDTGHWRLSDTGYCLTWTHLRGGKERCLTAQRDGESYQTFIDGKLSAQFRPE